MCLKYSRAELFKLYFQTLSAPVLDDNLPDASRIFSSKKNANRAAPQLSPRRSWEQLHTRQTMASVIPLLPLILVCEHHKPCSSVQAVQDYLLLEDEVRKSVFKSARVKDHMVQTRLTTVKMSPIQRTCPERL